MVKSVQEAMQTLRAAMSEQEDPVSVSMTVSRSLAEKLLQFLETEYSSGAVVVPVKDLYTTTESATILGISRATLMKLIDSGEIEAVKVGTHHRVPADEIVAYQRERQVSHERAAELMTEFSSRSPRFHSNVTFRAGHNREE
ncbi:helix-turn-helix domain-containing protein [Agromyces laixinhei]|uniref:helix-turn-helix domain-containing protein n=1 Tax=Agromyces laixinhei TaxID=2585717 RepID=UPI001E3159EC|nr:helix-turn-helix domain-containing protein [Agromyces laixinhei]